MSARRKSVRAIRAGVLAAVFAATPFALPACQPEPTQAPVAASQPEPTQAPVAASPSLAGAVVVEPRTITELKPVAGEITTRQTGLAVARTGGTLIQLNVREGDMVEAGQVIGVVRDERTDMQTAGYDAVVQAAVAEAERADAELVRTKRLFEKGVYAKARVDQVQAAARAAHSNLEAARAQRSASAELGAQGAILAPASGRVLKADVPVGSVVMAGQSIATVTSGPLVVRVLLPEGQAGSLKVGLSVEMTPDGPGGATARARIDQVYPAVEVGQVVADIDAAGLDASLIGRRIAVRLPVGERTAIVIPRSFVITRFGVDYVRLVRGGGVADTPVQTGPGPDAASVEILSGLIAGDRILPPASPAEAAR